MKLPRDLGGEELASLLRHYGYQLTRQTGSHMRLTASARGARHHLTIPRDGSLRVGTLAGILNDVAAHLQVDRDTLLKELFESR